MEKRDAHKSENVFNCNVNPIKCERLVHVYTYDFLLTVPFHRALDKNELLGVGMEKVKKASHPINSFHWKISVLSYDR